MSDDSLKQLIQERRVLVLLGAGGVGKTTSAIAVALVAARLGRRVALLSIDPARRLAAALGIPLGNQLRRIALPADSGITGTIDAAMLDQKAVFDGMVRRHAPSDQLAERILAHPVYRSASTNLAGPLEYMALAKLQELSEDHRYDLVVLDTPPDTHALDFLARPNVLAGFMENRVMSWLIKPFLVAGRLGLGRLINVSERLAGGIAKVMGVKALQTFGEFLVLMQEVIEGFHGSGEKIITLLHRPETSFMVITVPTEAATRSAGYLTEQLKELGYHCDTLVFNRCLPRTVALALRARPAAEDPALSRLFLRLEGEAAVMAALVSDLTARGAPPIVRTVQDQERDMSELAALIAMAAELA